MEQAAHYPVISYCNNPVYVFILASNHLLWFYFVSFLRFIHRSATLLPSPQSHLIGFDISVSTSLTAFNLHLDPNFPILIPMMLFQILSMTLLHAFL